MVEPPTIKCLTLWRPWSSYVAFGRKSIETRLHGKFAGLAGSWVGIHAAQKYDALDLFTEIDGREHAYPRIEKHAEQTVGRLVALVHFGESRLMQKNDEQAAMLRFKRWPRRWCLTIDHVYPLSAPIEVSGQQGIWKMTDERLREVLSAAGRCYIGGTI